MALFRPSSPGSTSNSTSSPSRRLRKPSALIDVCKDSVKGRSSQIMCMYAQDGKPLLLLCLF
jgi:hypothetical protein